VELLATDAHQTCLVARAPGAPAELVSNLDETPLKLMPTSGYTWTEKGAKNVEGTLDKRQFTLTPIISATGVIAVVQIIFAGATDKCLPPPDFRSEFKAKFAAAKTKFDTSSPSSNSRCARM